MTDTAGLDFEQDLVGLWFWVWCLLHDERLTEGPESRGPHTFAEHLPILRRDILTSYPPRQWVL